METRNYTDLEYEINRFYNNYTIENLRNHVSYRYGDITVNNPYTKTFTYDSGTNYEHKIEISIPGKKAFVDRRGKLTNFKNSNDIKIIVIEKSGNKKTLTHEDIVRDLYTKIDGNYKKYIWYRDFLKALYSNYSINQFDWKHSIYEVESKGYDLPLLVSFLRWCGTQEDINYSTGWGKDLSFSRNFEVIYAGYLENKKLLNDICERANTQGKPPYLYENIKIKGEYIDIYNSCLDNHKTKGTSKLPIYLCIKCGKDEASE